MDIACGGPGPGGQTHRADLPRRGAALYPRAMRQTRLFLSRSRFRSIDYLGMVQALRKRVCRTWITWSPCEADAGGIPKVYFASKTWWTGRPWPTSTAYPGGDPNWPKCRLYTSGTTGFPKAVLHTHNTLMHIQQCSIRHSGINARRCDGHALAGNPHHRLFQRHQHGLYERGAIGVDGPLGCGCRHRLSSTALTAP